MPESRISLSSEHLPLLSPGSSLTYMGSRHRVLPISIGNCGFPSDDEDDLDLGEVEFA